MLEFGSRAEFDDPKLEYRRLYCELLITFMLAAVGGIVHAKRQISLVASVFAPGSMVLAIICSCARWLARTSIRPLREGLGALSASGARPSGT